MADSDFAIYNRSDAQLGTPPTDSVDWLLLNAVAAQLDATTFFRAIHPVSIPENQLLINLPAAIVAPLPESAQRNWDTNVEVGVSHDFRCVLISAMSMGGINASKALQPFYGIRETAKEKLRLLLPSKQAALAAAVPSWCDTDILYGEVSTRSPVKGSDTILLVSGIIDVRFVVMEEFTT